MLWFYFCCRLSSLLGPGPRIRPVNDDKRIMAAGRRDHNRGDTLDDNSGIANFLDMVARTKVLAQQMCVLRCQVFPQRIKEENVQIDFPAAIVP